MRDLTPAIEIHLVGALVVVVLGLAVILTRKGTSLHRYTGRIWWLAMFVTAVSSFGIKEIGGIFGWSWIHLLSLYTLAALVLAIVAIRRGNIRRHRQNMIASFSGLVIAGAFALIPGRRVGDFLYGLI